MADYAPGVRNDQIRRDVVKALELRAGVALYLGRHAGAARLFGSAARQRRDARWRIDFTDRARIARKLDAVRAARTGQDFERVWEAGQAMSFEDAVALASAEA